VLRSVPRADRVLSASKLGLEGALFHPFLVQDHLRIVHPLIFVAVSGQQFEGLELVNVDTVGDLLPVFLGQSISFLADLRPERRLAAILAFLLLLEPGLCLHPVQYKQLKLFPQLC